MAASRTAHGPAPWWLPGRQLKRPAWYLEIPLLVVGYLAFGLARGRIDRGEQLATGNAQIIQGLEQHLHIAVETPLNQAILAYPFAIHLTGYFYRLCVIAVPVILVWSGSTSDGRGTTVTYEQFSW